MRRFGCELRDTYLSSIARVFNGPITSFGTNTPGAQWAGTVAAEVSCTDAAWVVGDLTAGVTSSVGWMPSLLR